MSVRLQVAGELAHRLGHHPRLQADGLVAHLALELGPRRERGDRVDRDHVDRAGAHEHVGDLERLLAVVGLRDEQLVDVDADLPRVQRVHRVLGVDERAHPAELLGLGQDVVHQRRLAGGLRAEDLDDAPARHAADPEREVERERPGRHDPDTHLGALVAHAHDGALAELAFDLGERALEGGIAGLGGLLVFGDGHGRRTFLLWLRRAMLRPGADGTDPRSGSCGGATPLCSDSAKNLFQLSAQTPVDTGIARDSVRRRVDGAAHVRTPPSPPAARAERARPPTVGDGDR